MKNNRCSFAHLCLWASLLLLIGLLTGCASTVTQKDVVGNKLRIELTLANNVSSQAKYYFVFSYTGDPLFPNLQSYLIGPGEHYNNQSLIDIGKDISYYYANYFYSWTDFIVLDSSNNSFALTPGPFPVSADSIAHYKFTRQALGQNLSTTPNQIVLYFDLANLNKGAAINKIYFNILTVDANDKLQNSLGSEQIQNILGSVLVGTSPPQGQDILQWKVNVE